MISLNSSSIQDQSVFDLPESYPFSLNDGAILPTDRTGYVYCLVSRNHRGHIYIGETECISQRQLDHKSGSGSISTENIRYRPWAVAYIYICVVLEMCQKLNIWDWNRDGNYMYNNYRQGDNMKFCHGLILYLIL